MSEAEGPIDPALERLLAEASQEEAEPEGGPDLAPVFEEIQARIGEAEGRRSFWLATRPTRVRRAICWGTLALVALLGGVLTLRADFGDYPLPRMMAALGALFVLGGLSLHHALRPVHQPPLPRWVGALVVLAALGATFTLALLPPAHAGGLEGVGAHGAAPCLLYGLLFGLPVYGMLRVLDRGGGSPAPLLGASAAGLAGNLVLQLHCPQTDPTHLLAGHFAVAALFIGGIGLIHLVTRRAR